MILGIETSCDESAVAIFDPEKGLRGEWISSQVALHGKHGGVVPDLAAREHLRNLPPLLDRAKAEVGLGQVTRVAVTTGPGLAACLALGVTAAKALATGLHIPLVAVNHLRAHAWSPFLGLHREGAESFPENLDALLPHLGLVVSGGNTLLVEITRERKMRVVASTRDDAAGEALDKGAKLMGLDYPGGPVVEKLARGGNPAAYDFPRGIVQRDDLDFSFSGLKTSLRYLLEKMAPGDVAVRLPDLCASYQQAVIDSLRRKTTFALARQPYASLGLSGGVSNNRKLRAAISAVADQKAVKFYAAEPQHTGDNAAMIAFAAWVDAPVSADSRASDIGIAPDAPIDAER